MIYLLQATDFLAIQLCRYICAMQQKRHTYCKLFEKCVEGALKGQCLISSVCENADAKRGGDSTEYQKQIADPGRHLPLWQGEDEDINFLFVCWSFPFL